MKYLYTKNETTQTFIVWRFNPEERTPVTIKQETI